MTHARPPQGHASRSETRLHCLHEKFQPLDPLAQSFKRTCHRVEQLRRARFFQCVRLDVLGSLRPASGEQPLPVDPPSDAHRRKKLGTRGLPLHVPADCFRIRIRRFPDGPKGFVAKDFLKPFV